MKKERVTICVPANILEAIDSIPGWSRSGFISHILTMYIEQMVQHYRSNTENIIKSGGLNKRYGI